MRHDSDFKMNKEQMLSGGKILPLILKMSFPCIVAQLINLLYGIVDRIFIGHIPEIGRDALAGVGITNSVIILISAFSAFVSSGGASLAAISLGKGDRKKAEKILGNGFFLLVVFTVLCVTAVYIFKTPLLFLIGASEVTYKYASDYITFYLLGTFFVMISLGLNTFITAQGRSGIAMISVVLGALLNIALDPLFIHTFGLGVRGAAIATVISQGASAVWIMAFLLSPRASMRLRPVNFKPDIRIILRILALGSGPFVMSSTESLVGFVLNGSLKHYGGDIYVSALTVMQSGMQIIGVPIAGFGQGISPVISYNYGRGNVQRVKKIFRVSLTVMFSVNLVLTLGQILFPAKIASVFTNDEALIELTAGILPVFLAGMTIFGLQRACQNAFVALGQSFISLMIAILRKIILLIPLALLLPRFVTPSVFGVFLAEPIADALAATVCTVVFFCNFSKILSKSVK